MVVVDVDKLNIMCGSPRVGSDCEPALPWCWLRGEEGSMTCNSDGLTGAGPAHCVLASASQC